MPGMTIEQVKERKIKLESKILKLFKDFEKETASFVGFVDTRRKPRRKSNKKSIDHEVMPEHERDGPLMNVNIDLRFDI